MLVKQLWEGTDAFPWILKLDGRTKLILLLSFAILSITVDNPRTLFWLFTATLLFHILVGTSIYKWKVLAILLILGLWGAMFSQALFFAQTPRTPLAVLVPPEANFLGRLTGGVYIYREGIIYGAVQGLRSAAMLALGLLVCWTSDPRQLLKALMNWHLTPQVAFMLVTAIRFLPVLASETGEVITALQLRSASPNGRSAIICHLPYIIKPLLARCLRRAQTLSLSVVSRGFFRSSVAKNYTAWPAREKIPCMGFFIAVMFVLVCKVAYLLSEQGIYIGMFRKIYDWTVLYL